MVHQVGVGHGAGEHHLPGHAARCRDGFQRRLIRAFSDHQVAAVGMARGDGGEGADGVVDALLLHQPAHRDIHEAAVQAVAGHQVGRARHRAEAGDVHAVLDQADAVAPGLAQQVGDGGGGEAADHDDMVGSKQRAAAAVEPHVVGVACGDLLAVDIDGAVTQWKQARSTLSSQALATSSPMHTPVAPPRSSRVVQAKAQPVPPARRPRRAHHRAQQAEADHPVRRQPVVLAPGDRRQPVHVVQLRRRANDLVIEGAASETTVITDKVCHGKALFIIDGARITIRNLTLTRARVADLNGAGIRAEGGDLTIEHVRFINDQDGILAAPSRSPATPSR